MAVIGKIRSYSGLLIIIIGVALAAFVLGDFFKKSNSGSAKDFAQIAGEDVSYFDFQNKIQQQEAMYMERMGQENLSQEQHDQIRNQVWNDMLREVIFKKEFDELGISVSTAELLDLVTGNDPHPIIRQTFVNQQTGQIDKVRINQIIQSEGQMEPKMQEQWDYLKEQIKLERIYSKYTSLVSKGYYVPKALARLDFDQKNLKSTVRFLSVKYATVPDASVKVTDAALEEYYNAHKHEYNNLEASRHIEYVVFDVNPSQTDIVKASKEIMKIRAEFADAKDVAEYVNSVSEERYDSAYKKKGELPLRFDTLMFSIAPGTIVGPLTEGNMSYMAKLVSRMNRPDSIKAKHILIAYQDALRVDPNNKRSKVAAKKLADSIRIAVAADTNRFKELATKYSDDPASKQNFGDYGWFEDGRMVSEFTDACIRGNIGETVVTETPFGYHVILINNKTRAIEKVRVAAIEYSITASNATTDSIRKVATMFEANNRTIEAIEKAANKLGLNKRSAESVKDMDNDLPGMSNSREIVRWSFNEEVKVGDIKLFEVIGEPSKYVVASLKDIREKGILTLAQVKATIEPKVKDELKGAELAKKISALVAKTKDINALAQQLNTKVDTADNISFSSYAMPGAGAEPKVIARIATMKPNKLSEPVIGKVGVYVVWVDKSEMSPEKYDQKATSMQMGYYFMNRVNYDILNVLKKTADIMDNRRFFY